jgi:PPP family 3-phenylpropionic acid transporter
MDQARRGFWSLSAHWFFATGALGVFYPYFSLFLRENVGLSGTQVGMVVAIPPLVGVVAQPLWGQLADRTGSRAFVLALVCLGTALGYVALCFSLGLLSTVLATVLLASFLSALFPMATSVTFAALPESGWFGRIRVWGTLGYLIVVVATPELLHAFRESGALGSTPNTGVEPSEPGLERMFLLAAGLMLLGAFALVGLPKSRALELRSERGDLRALLAHRPFMRLLIFSVAAQLALHGPMLLFPLYVRSRGGSMTDLSHLWIWMISLEVPLILGSGRLRTWLGAPRIIRNMRLTSAT